MKLSSKARYAVEAMLELAINPDRPVTLASISEKQHISQSYLEQLFMRLRRQGLIKGARGPGGGYRLGHDANAISIADIVIAVDERAGPATPHGKAPHPQTNITRLMWDDLSRQIYSFLGSVTLGQLVHNFESRKVTTLPRRPVEHSKAA